MPCPLSFIRKVTHEELTLRMKDEGHGIDIIFLDYCKAFDTVPHRRLLTLHVNLAKCHDTWNVEETLKLIEIVKSYHVLWQTDHQKEYGRKGPRDAGRCCASVAICCTMRANGSFAIHGNVEFFCCRMRKSDEVICGTFRASFFASYPLTTFRNPHPTKTHFLYLHIIYYNTTVQYFGSA